MILLAIIRKARLLSFTPRLPSSWHDLKINHRLIGFKERTSMYWHRHTLHHINSHDEAHIYTQPKPCSKSFIIKAEYTSRAHIKIIFNYRHRATERENVNETYERWKSGVRRFLMTEKLVIRTVYTIPHVHIISIACIRCMVKCGILHRHQTP